MFRFLWISFVLFFLGCSTHSSHFDTQKIKEQALIQTKKQEVFTKKARFLFVVSYLNPIKNTFIKNTNEKFLVNVYVDKNTNLKITKVNLNNAKARLIRLEAKSNIAKLSPNYSKWATYFLIQAPPQKSKNLALSFKIDNLTQVYLNFPKDILD